MLSPSPASAAMSAGADVPPAAPFARPGCAVCGQLTLPSRARRFGGRRVCAECWHGLTRLERSGAFRRLPRTSLLAHFTAEVALRLPAATAV